MSSSRPRSLGMQAVLAVVVLGLFAAMLVSLEWFEPLPLPGHALQGKMADTQRTAIGLIVDLAKLFMGWSIVVIGGIAYFLKANLEKEYPLARLDLLLAEAVILVSIVSIFYGHLTINFMVEMLAADLMRLDDPTLAWNVRLQYLAFLLSLLLFGTYVHLTFWPRTKRRRAGDA